MRDTLRLGLILMLICAVSGGSLAYVYGITSKIIDERRAKEIAQSMKTVLPSAEDFAELPEADLSAIREDKSFADVEAVYTGSVGGSVEGIVAKLAASGYGGKITLLVGVKADRSVSGLQVLSHGETPGLGAKITNLGFQEQFIGKGASSAALAVSKDGGEIQAISGATISSRGVVAGVNTARNLVSTLGFAGGAAR